MAFSFVSLLGHLAGVLSEVISSNSVKIAHTRGDAR